MKRVFHPFVLGNFQRLLNTKTFGRPTLYEHSMPSTQKALHEYVQQSLSHLFCLERLTSRVLIHRNCASFHDGTCLVADFQTQGKGRGGNEWSSPEGCLMFSYKCSLTEGAQLPFFQYLVSLAVVRSLRSLRPDIANNEIALKWPNDIYWRGLKVGGVLCQTEMSFSAGETIFQIITGVGLNVSNAEPTTCVNDIFQTILGSDDRSVTREEVLSSFFNTFEEMFEEFKVRGFAPFETDYLQTWLHSGQMVTLHEGEPEEVKLKIAGITRSGFLKGVSDDGQVFELHPDGNSLDFFKGLIKRKIMA